MKWRSPRGLTAEVHRPQGAEGIIYGYQFWRFAFTEQVDKKIFECGQSRVLLEDGAYNLPVKRKCLRRTRE